MRSIEDLREVWQELRGSRYVLYQLIRRDIRIRYKQAIMGFAWAILMPLVVVLSGLVVRFAISYLSGIPFDGKSVAGLMVKALPWSFFVGSLGFATNSVAGNFMLVTKVYFAREVLPIAAVVAVAFDTLIGSVAVVMVLPFVGVQLSLTFLWVPLLLSLLFLFTLGCGLILSCANVFFRDVKYLVQVVVSFGIFFTPVFFEPGMLGETVGRLAMLNPVAPLLEGLRLSIVEGHDLLTSLPGGPGRANFSLWTPWYLGYCAAWTVGLLSLSTIVFHRA